MHVCGLEACLHRKDEHSRASAQALKVRLRLCALRGRRRGDRELATAAEAKQRLRADQERERPARRRAGCRRQQRARCASQRVGGCVCMPGSQPVLYSVPVLFFAYTRCA